VLNVARSCCQHSLSAIHIRVRDIDANGDFNNLQYIAYTYMMNVIYCGKLRIYIHRVI
jgi:acyl-ACP thioesterase